MTKRNKRAPAKRARKTRLRAKKIGWSLLALLLLILALPLLERQALLGAYNSDKLQSQARSWVYSYSKSLYQGQSPLSWWFYWLAQELSIEWLPGASVQAAVSAYELEQLSQLLGNDEYEAARSFALDSVFALSDARITELIRGYESEQFDDLRDQYLKVDFDWSYDAYRLSIPGYMRPYIDKDFFSVFLPYREVSLRRYKPASYDGVFLALKLSNDFLVLQPVGSISFEAKGKSDIKGTLKSIASTVMSGVGGMVDKGIEVAVDVWNGTEPPRVLRLTTPPRTSAWHIGKAFKPAKGFELEPKMVQQDWQSS